MIKNSITYVTCPANVGGSGDEREALALYPDGEFALHGAEIRDVRRFGSD